MFWWFSHCAKRIAEQVKPNRIDTLCRRVIYCACSRCTRAIVATRNWCGSDRCEWDEDGGKGAGGGGREAERIEYSTFKLNEGFHSKPHIKSHTAMATGRKSTHRKNRQSQRKRHRRCDHWLCVRCISRIHCIIGNQLIFFRRFCALVSLGHTPIRV